MCVRWIITLNVQNVHHCVLLWGYAIENAGENVYVQLTLWKSAALTSQHCLEGRLITWFICNVPAPLSYWLLVSRVQS